MSRPKLVKVKWLEPKNYRFCRLAIFFSSFIHGYVWLNFALRTPDIWGFFGALIMTFATMTIGNLAFQSKYILVSEEEAKKVVAGF